MRWPPSSGVPRSEDGPDEPAAVDRGPGADHAGGGSRRDRSPALLHDDSRAATRRGGRRHARRGEPPGSGVRVRHASHRAGRGRSGVEPRPDQVAHGRHVLPLALGRLGSLCRDERPRRRGADGVHRRGDEAHERDRVGRSGTHRAHPRGQRTARRVRAGALPCGNGRPDGTGRLGDAMNIKRVLSKMVEMKASDLHVKVGTKPTARVNGELLTIDEPAPSQVDLEAVVDQILTPKQKKVFEETKEVDFAFGVTGLARFRTNFYQQRGTTAMVFRQVPATIPAFEELNLPASIEELASRPRGLILVCGTVGSGKSTTLAAMLDSVNRREAKNVITIEDPVEFLFRDKKSTISQREIGLDTSTFAEGLKHILRQDPDVIMIGEIRDATTMATALMAADTGHMVFSTLHTIDATQTVNRIMSFFPPHQHEEIRFMLSSTLQAVIGLRLVPRSDIEGRIPAAEVMLVTSTIREYLLDPEKTSLIKTAIADGVSTYGMQTFDQSLMQIG